MSRPESNPDDENVRKLWLNTLCVEAETIRAQLAFAQQLTSELTKNMEKYLSEGLLMGTPFTDEEQQLCSHLGFLCSRTGQETPAFIQWNYLSNSQDT